MENILDKGKKTPAGKRAWGELIARGGGFSKTQVGGCPGGSSH